MKFSRRDFIAAALATTALTGPAEAAQGRYVAWGDSIAYGIGASNNITNLGISGAGLLNGDVRGLINNLGRIRENDIVIVSVGTNDAAYIHQGSVSMDDYKARLAGRIQEMIDRGARPVILGVSSENYGYWGASLENFANGPFNDAIRDVASSLHVPFSQTGGRGVARAGDGLHYTTRGYRQLFENALQDMQSAKRVSIPLFQLK